MSVFVFDNRRVRSFFTGLANGDIVQVFLPPTFERAQYKVVAHLSSDPVCHEAWHIEREHICGRPLGMSGF